MRAIPLSTVFLTGLLLAFSAAAEPSASQRALASQLFDDGAKLVAEGKVDEACPKYAESLRLDPQLGTRLHLADCYERAGRIASAWATFKDAVEIAAQRKDPRVANARAQVAQLEKRLPKLVIVVGARMPQDLEVRQDGEVVGRTVWGSPVPVDPGNHSITVKASGYESWSRVVEVRADGTSVVVTVPELEREPALSTRAEPAAMAPSSTPSVSTPAPARPAPVDSVASKPDGTQRTIGYVVGGVGVVGLAMGMIFGLQTKSRLSERGEVCPGYVNCTAGEADQIRQLTDDARGSATLSTLGFVGGAAALIGGAVLVVTAPSRRRQGQAAGLDVGPWVGANTAGASIGCRW